MTVTSIGTPVEECASPMSVALVAKNSEAPSA